MGTSVHTAALCRRSSLLCIVHDIRWQDSVGPRKVATVGGILLRAGYILASLVETLGFASDLVMGTVYLVITYGIIGGAGIGFAYVCPIACLVKWFPDKKGAITGVAVAGFGGGALIFLIVEQFLLALSGGYVGMPFLVLGIVHLIGVVLGAQVLSNPPVSWTRRVGCLLSQLLMALHRNDSRWSD